MAFHHINTDTTYTKIFVGGLAWETQRDTMHRYFEQFGDILEAVVITDKNTGRSKGYGFVTFKDPESAMRSCQDPSPMIDGRRANCNLASLGAAANRAPTSQYGMDKIRPQTMNSISNGYFNHPTNYAFPYYGYSGGYPQENMYHPMSYYQANPGIYPNYNHYYAQYPHSAQSHGSGFGLHYPQVLQYYPYSPQPFGSGSSIQSLPASVAAPTAGVTAVISDRSLIG